MLVIKGTGKKNGEMPLGLEAAKEYFQDLSKFITKIEEVDQCKPLKRPNTYLVTHKPIGAMNFYTTVVYCMEVEWSETGVVFKPLDFEPEQIKSEHMVLKGFVNGGLNLKPVSADTTAVDLVFELNVELPIPPALKLVPQGLVKTTADGIMTMKVAASVESMYKKVLEDFDAVAP
jgi:hypothetical protein